MASWKVMAADSLTDESDGIQVAKTLYDIRPHGVAINYFYQNGEFSARLQYTAHLLKTVRQVWPEIHRLYCCHEVELPIFVRQLFGRTLSNVSKWLFA